ncbi:MAG TPA: glycosyltransferase [Myxococcota bacterium]|nr:glycosyltransferase [Myxococcota bacterium]
MRICVLVATYPLVSETFVYEPVRWLAERGHDVTVLAKRAGSLPREDGVETPVVAPRVLTPAREALAWLRAPGDALRRLPRVRVAARALLPEVAAADALLAHFGKVGERWLPVAAAARRPYAVFFHGNDATGELRGRPRRYDALFRSGAGLIVNCDFMAERLAAAGAPRERLAVIPNGVDASLAATTRPASDARTVLTVGRLVEKKGVADSLAAFARAALPADWRYEIVGDGPLRASLERAAQGAGAVRFRGFLPRARTLDAIRAASLLVLASRTAASGDAEGTPNCVIEAATCGVPVVATRHGGIPELLPADAEARGFLVREGDVDAIARAIASLAASEALRREWGEACRAHIRKRHSADAHVTALVGALERVARVPSL